MKRRQKEASQNNWKAADAFDQKYAPTIWAQQQAHMQKHIYVGMRVCVCSSETATAVVNASVSNEIALLFTVVVFCYFHATIVVDRAVASARLKAQSQKGSTNVSSSA